MRTSSRIVPTPWGTLGEEVTNSWTTPEEVMTRVYRLGEVGLDPCHNSNSPVRARATYDLVARGENGLELPWAGRGTAFCNPPFGRTVWRGVSTTLADWAKKVVSEASQGAEIVYLVRTGVSTEWSRTLLSGCPLLCEPFRRVAYGAPEGVVASTPDFTSSLYYFGSRRGVFTAAFRDFGAITDVTEFNASSVTCAVCGRLMEPGGRRPRLTCSIACRVAACRKRLEERMPL